MRAIDRFLSLVDRGLPHVPSEDTLAENVDDGDINTPIREIMADADKRDALIDLIESMADESNAMMSMGRKDHTDMLYHHGGYARLQELKSELMRLSGLTRS